MRPLDLGIEVESEEYYMGAHPGSKTEDIEQPPPYTEYTELDPLEPVLDNPQTNQNNNRRNNNREDTWGNIIEAVIAVFCIAAQIVIFVGLCFSF